MSALDIERFSKMVHVLKEEAKEQLNNHVKIMEHVTGRIETTASVLDIGMQVDAFALLFGLVKDLEHCYTAAKDIGSLHERFKTVESKIKAYNIDEANYPDSVKEMLELEDSVNSVAKTVYFNLFRHLDFIVATASSVLQKKKQQEQQEQDEAKQEETKQ